MIDAAGSRADMAKSCANRNAASRRRFTYDNMPPTVATDLRNIVPEQRGYNRGMTKETRDMLARWLREALTARDMSVAELLRRIEEAGMAGLTAPKISRVLSGERDLSYEEVAKITGILGVSPPLLDVAKFAKIRVIGEVQAGLWREADHDGFQPFEILFGGLGDMSLADHYFGLVVRGDSINRTAPDGSIAVCLPIEHAPRTHRDGDWVVVERVRGDLTEQTIKRVGRVDGKVMLVPDSHDPRFQPVAPGKGNPEIVRVAAFVVGFQHAATVF